MKTLAMAISLKYSEYRLCLHTDSEMTSLGKGGGWHSSSWLRHSVAKQQITIKRSSRDQKQ